MEAIVKAEADHATMDILLIVDMKVVLYRLPMLYCMNRCAIKPKAKVNEGEVVNLSFDLHIARK